MNGANNSVDMQTKKLLIEREQMKMRKDVAGWAQSHRIGPCCKEVGWLDFTLNK